MRLKGILEMCLTAISRFLDFSICETIQHIYPYPYLVLNERDSRDNVTMYKSGRTCTKACPEECKPFAIHREDILQIVNRPGINFISGIS